MRQRVQQSPLCDPKLFTKHIENAFSNMWERLDASTKIETRAGISVRNNATEPTQQDVQKLIDLFNSGNLSEAEKQGYRLLKSFPSSFAVSNILAGTLFTLKSVSFDRCL